MSQPKRQSLIKTLLTLCFLITIIINCASKIRIEYFDTIVSPQFYVATLHKSDFFGKLDSIISISKRKIPKCNWARCPIYSFHITDFDVTKDGVYYDTEDLSADEILRILNNMPIEKQTLIRIQPTYFPTDDGIVMYNHHYYGLSHSIYNTIKTQTKFHKKKITYKIRGSIVTTPKGKIKNEWLGEIIKAPNITILLDPNGTMQLIDCECDRYE